MSEAVQHLGSRGKTAIKTPADGERDGGCWRELGSSSVQLSVSNPAQLRISAQQDSIGRGASPDIISRLERLASGACRWARAYGTALPPGGRLGKVTWRRRRRPGRLGGRLGRGRRGGDGRHSLLSPLPGQHAQHVTGAAQRLKQRHAVPQLGVGHVVKPRLHRHLSDERRTVSYWLHPLDGNVVRHHVPTRGYKLNIGDRLTVVIHSPLAMPRKLTATQEGITNII